jgi:hypothetical protein
MKSVHTIHDLCNLAFDEVCTSFTTLFATIAFAIRERIQVALSEKECDLIFRKLLTFLQGVARLPRSVGMPHVFQIDFLGEGFHLIIKDGHLKRIRFSGITVATAEKLAQTPKVDEFLQAAKNTTVSTGCPALHVSKIGNVKDTLFKTFLEIFVQTLRNEIFPSSNVKSSLPLDGYYEPLLKMHQQRGLPKAAL